MPKKFRKKIKLTAEDVNTIIDRMEEIAQDEGVAKEIDVVPLAEMAVFMGVSIETLRRRVSNKDIKAYKAGNGKIYFLRSDFDQSLFSESDMMTCQDVARKMNVTPRAVRKWIGKGKLVARRYGWKWLITQDDLLDFLEIGMYE